jgi:hypothetical protein
MRLRHSLLALALSAITIAPALAADFDFANLTYNSGSNSGFRPTDGVACTGGDLCSSNVDGGVLSGDLTFVSGGLTAFATGSFMGGVAAVVQDHENGYNPSTHIGAGLGVYHQAGNNSDDNITNGEKLTLTFDHLVTLTNIGLRSDGHDLGWASGSTFLLNGVSTLFPSSTGSLSTAMTGTTFTFEFGGAKASQFYLSSVTAVSAVPEPGSLALMLSGLGVIFTIGRRRAR